MVLIEAGRQMFLAVTERFFSRPGRESAYFVISRFDTTFLQFAFPLRTVIRFAVLEHRRCPNEVDAFEVLIHFLQDEQPVAKSVVAFSVYPKALSRGEGNR